MVKFCLFVLMTLSLLGCGGVTDNAAGKKDQLISKSAKKEDLFRNTENLQCKFSNPDTSVFGIAIRDAKSAAHTIGGSVADSSGEYHFYSKLEGETLTLVQHPGDFKNQISIFRVEYSSKASYNYKQLAVDAFKTESGIKLGMAKNQIIEKLGGCYSRIDSTSKYIELYYRIEQPKDSRTKLLKRNSMPAYYASYKLHDNKLERMEFGFEYP